MKNITVFLCVIFLSCSQLYAQPSFSAKTDFTTTSNPSSVSFADFNGDGKQDLATGNYFGDNVSVFLNTTETNASSPSFSTRADFSAGAHIQGSAVGDLNGDGKPDIVATRHNSLSISIFRNTTATNASSATFVRSDFSAGTQPYSVAIGDLNGDGKLDVAVANDASDSISVFFNTTTTGSTTFSFSTRVDFLTGDGPRSVAIGDINGDGKLDIAVANSGSNSVSVFLNTTTTGSATPSFSAKTDFSTANFPTWVCIGDINGDGKPDLAAACYNGQRVSVLLNTTTIGDLTPIFSTKTDFTTASGTRWVSLRDLNGDGKLDIAAPNEGATTVSVFLNSTTAGSSTPSFLAKVDLTTGTSPYSAASGDINGDGKPDLVVTNNSGSLSVFMNQSTMGVATASFSAKTDSSAGHNVEGCAIGDLNGDGKPDFVVTLNALSKVGVFFNTTTPGGSTSTVTSHTDFDVHVGPTSVIIKDLNGDGKGDIIAGCKDGSKVSILMNTTTPGDLTPSFSAATNVSVHSPYDVATADFNGDGKMDIVAVNYSAATASVMFNTTPPGDATPTFSSVSTKTTGSNPISVGVGDFNNDGKPDFVTANRTDPGSISIFLNTTTSGSATPSFSDKEDYTTGANSRGVTVADLNGDGKADIIAVNESGTSMSVFMNSTTPGSGSTVFSTKFDFTTGNGPYTVCSGDVNGDGIPDIIVANSGASTVSVLLNITTPGATTPNFSTKSDFTTANSPQRVAVGDINGDGKLDIAAASYPGSVLSMLLNQAVLPLPVELSTFTASVAAKRVTLNWVTETEINNYGFEIERSVKYDNPEITNWLKLGFVRGHVLSNSPKTYSYTDESVASGKYLYRLKQLDNDGSFEYSPVLEIDVDPLPSKYMLAENYPNPFNPGTVISFELPVKSYTSLRIYDILGKEVSVLINEEKEAGRYSVKFDAGALSSGIYFSRLEAGGYTFIKKMILLR